MELNPKYYVRRSPCIEVKIKLAKYPKFDFAPSNHGDRFIKIAYLENLNTEVAA